MTTPLLTPATPWPPQAGNVYQIDALLLMAEMARYGVTVDAIITDLPYGTTALDYDKVIPFVPMWAAVKRILKPRGVFVTTASQPFTTNLIVSNSEWFRYEWIWVKTMPTGFLDANRKPLKLHENICVFSDGRANYYPQMRKGRIHTRNSAGATNVYGAHANRIMTSSDEFYPTSVLQFKKETGEHPTQKPVALYRYLIETYTQPGELVLDFCCGSGTTAVAAFQCGRRFIAGDTSAEYVEIARRRLMHTTQDMFASERSA